MHDSDELGFELVVSHTGQVFRLRQELVTIGAASDNRIILADPDVSAYHAEIDWVPQLNGYILRNVSSTGGTFVNERPVQDPYVLRHGDVLRLGNTLMDYRAKSRVEPASVVPPLGDDGEREVRGIRHPLLLGVFVFFLAGLTLACAIFVGALVLTSDRGAPDVIIQSPSDSAQIVANQEITLRAIASGAKDITLLEMNVDGVLVATATSVNAGGQSSLALSKPWTFTVAGPHEISAVAHTAQGKKSPAAEVQVIVVEPVSSVPGTPTATLTLEPTETPTPEATSTPTPTLALPPALGTFEANPASIPAGACTTLQWGAVAGAAEVHIEPEIGGVATPGSVTVCPTETTTYVLTARGPGGEARASVLVRVEAALADLAADAIIFEPNPPIVGQTAEVKLVVRNAGEGAAQAFTWEWRAGADAQFNGRLMGLEAGETTVVTVRWKPSAAYDRLETVLRLDVDGEVAESDKDNNTLWTVVEVVEKGGGGPRTVRLTSEPALDGYRSNDGRGSHKQDIFVGNSEIRAGEVVWRGFMSFDLSSIPSHATIDNVELRFFQARVGGTPYESMGNLVLEHVYYGDQLTGGAFDIPALHSAVLDRQTQARAWYILTSPLFGEWLETDLMAGRSHFQLRLRWQVETDGDGKEDYVSIESADNYYGSGNFPTLIVDYTQ